MSTLNSQQNLPQGTDVEEKDCFVVTVGDRLLVLKKKGSLLESTQSCEYMITFDVARRLFAKLNEQCLISGAFDIFRKRVLLDIDGVDTDTVGEDIELVLRLQDVGSCSATNKIVHVLIADCYTNVLHSFKRLLYQWDRCQRGLKEGRQGRCRNQLELLR